LITHPNPVRVLNPDRVGVRVKGSLIPDFVKFVFFSLVVEAAQTQ
jgi:hypothetical protein